MNSTFGNRTRAMVLLAIVLLAGFPRTGFAGGKKASDPTAPAQGPEETDVEKIKERYWARGNEMEMRVVQNRLYTNWRKFELGLLMGSVSSDPFLLNMSLTGTVGYHFSELFSLHLGYSRNFVGPSSALTRLEELTGSTASTNMQKYWLTAESRWNMLYGKVSLFGSSILYFDLYLTGGLGMVATESGNNLAILPGIGQVFHINQNLGINIHYRVFWYRERILSKAPGTLGQELGTNSNFGSTLMLGITFVLDPFSASEAPPGEKPAEAK